MILFTARKTDFHSCPNCEALEKRIDLDSVPGLTVYRLPDDLKPHQEGDTDGLAEADYYDVMSTPTLIADVDDDAKRIVDVFTIMDLLKEAAKNGE